MTVMDEQTATPSESPDRDEDEGTSTRTDPVPERTGNEAVDGVLDSLAGLADQPVADHVAVFERAHEQLRAALDPPRQTES